MNGSTGSSAHTRGRARWIGSPGSSGSGPSAATACFAIESRETGEFLGRGGLYYWEQFDEVEAGWTLRAEAWGHGYATEAAQGFLSWGFETLEAPYVTAMIRPGNTASVRVAERLGFTAERQDALFGEPVTVYVLNRSAALATDG